jgi:predicted ATPase/class 3 adenylate cyclase
MAAETTVFVTMLFTDIEGSTGLWEAHPDEMQAALARHDRLVREAIEAAGGRVVKPAGDGFCAAFESAPAAVTAAVAAQRAMATEPWPPDTPIHIRVAVHSATCEARAGDYFGPPVNRVARLMAIANGGQTLVSRATHALVHDTLDEGVSLRDCGDHRLKDLLRPERVYQLHSADLPDVPTPLRSLDNPALSHNLPVQVSSFIGRDDAVKEVRGALDTSRLVTLTGAGGVGKTRLALQVAAETLDGSGDGVWLVELASRQDPDWVVGAVASALWVREQPGRPLVDTLIDALGHRRLLLVLDNCEHVRDAAAGLTARLLRSCPGVVVLATSREPLGVAGEHLYRVPSLDVPPDGASAVAEVLGCSAVDLLVERAGQLRSDATLGPANAGAVASICRRLDGIPLAIELAAARLSSLSFDELSARLDQQFRLLVAGDRTGVPRHRTLRALVDWSYDLLDPDERNALRRLSTFAGGFTLESAHAVVAGGGGDEWDTLDVVTSLVDKSLVQADHADAGTRYRLLEPVRQYAAERLAAEGDDEGWAARVAHRDHYLALSEVAAPELRRRDQLHWFDRLSVEHDNLRVALATSFADPDRRGAEAAMRLVAALKEYWTVRGSFTEYADACEAAIVGITPADPPTLVVPALIAGSAARLRSDDFDAASRHADRAVTIARAAGDVVLLAEAHTFLGLALSLMTDDRARANLDRAVELARVAGNERVLADALQARGFAATFKGTTQLDVRRAACEEGLAILRSHGDLTGMSGAINLLTVIALELGDLGVARSYLEEGAELDRRLGSPSGISTGLVNLGLLTIKLGDLEAARRHLVEALRISRQLGQRLGLAYILLGFGLVASTRGEHGMAATLHGAADAAVENLGHQFEPLEAGMRRHDHARLRDHLGGNDFDAAYTKGRRLPLDDALALAEASAPEPDAGSTA